MKRLIRNLLNNEFTEKFLIILILLNIFIFIFETDNIFYTHYMIYIQKFELFSIIIFSFEYILRLLTLNQLKDLFKPLMIVDLLAILPFYLSFAKINTTIFRVMRLFRLLRIAKLTRYTSAIINIKRALIRKKEELFVTGIALGACLIIFSILIYYAEHNSGQKTFNSVPSSFWWSIITFTSVGYGDAYPTTSIGKIIGSFAAVLGLCFNGLFIGIIGSAFMETIEHRKIIKEKLKENNIEYTYEKAN